MGKPLILAEKLKPSGSNFREQGMMLSDMKHQKLILSVFQMKPTRFPPAPFSNQNFHTFSYLGTEDPISNFLKILLTFLREFKQGKTFYYSK